MQEYCDSHSEHTYRPIPKTNLSGVLLVVNINKSEYTQWYSTWRLAIPHARTTPGTEIEDITDINSIIRNDNAELSIRTVQPTAVDIEGQQYIEGSRTGEAALLVSTLDPDISMSDEGHKPSKEGNRTDRNMVPYRLRVRPNRK